MNLLKNSVGVGQNQPTENKSIANCMDRLHTCPEKGITLIALVVTIIILLILAGVALSLISRK